MNLIKIIILSLIFFLAITFHSLCETGEDVIGIVFSVKGTIIQKYNGTEMELKPGTKVYNSSILDLNKGSGRGKVQIMTTQGPVVYSRFPITFDKTSFASLSHTQQDNYIASIGGTVITGRAGEAENDFLPDEGDFDDDENLADSLFGWYMDIGLITPEFIDEGFAIILSKTRSSKENFSLSPLYFPLREDVFFSDISYTIMKDHTFEPVVEDGSFKKTDDGYVFSFRNIPLQPDITYIVEVSLTSENDHTDFWEFSFSIAGKTKMKEITEKITLGIDGVESEFEKNLVKARVYWEYNLKLSALGIFKNLGLDIEDHM